MCGVSGVELLLILVVAVVVLGPERLPEVARQLGRAMREVRKVTNEFTKVTNDVRSQVNVDELRAQLRREMQTERARAVKTEVTSEIDAIRAAMREAADGATGTTGSAATESTTPPAAAGVGMGASAAVSVVPTLRPAARIVSRGESADRADVAVPQGDAIARVESEVATEAAAPAPEGTHGAG